MKHKITLIALFLLSSLGLRAQEGVAGIVNDHFYGMKTVNVQTVRQLGKKVLAYRIQHRFGPFSDGAYNAFGLDGGASIAFSLDYGISDKLMVGMGRNSLNKLLEGYVKYSVLRQTTDNSMPLSLAVYGRANMTMLRNNTSVPVANQPYAEFQHRFSYVTQLMLARKFGNRVGVQLTPTWTHYNITEGLDFNNDVFTVVAQGHYKISKKLGISAEYGYNLNNYAPDSLAGSYRNSLGVGLDIVTGGHCFQVVLVNSFGINEAAALTQNTNDWLDGKFRLGFNISRDFWF